FVCADVSAKSLLRQRDLLALRSELNPLAMRQRRKLRQHLIRSLPIEVGERNHSDFRFGIPRHRRIEPLDAAVVPHLFPSIHGPNNQTESVIALERRGHFGERGGGEHLTSI